jgi:hypothetical protein
VILFEVDADGISIFPFKRDAPRTVYTDGIAEWFAT